MSTVNQKAFAWMVFTGWSQIGRKVFASSADTGDMTEPQDRTPKRETCDEVRSTRLHYRLRCLLSPGHDGDHRWTPELVPAGTEDDAVRAG
jgi:hypothetical protein